MSQLVVFTMIQYKISPKNLNSHLFSVELSFATQVGKVYHLSLPAWLPGSYMIRDFAKNIVEISAQSETQQNSENKEDIKLSKTDKQTWQFSAVSTFTIVKYQVFAFDLVPDLIFASNDVFKKKQK